ncbi:uncharacterized protein LOC115580777 [Sparus aurata]|uniref:Uncharacterized LOC115580777 n=1 Tax=Sparus aurata TaxID=8175 RepID=A0A671W0E8_SPAAU|nr:uncharacterized protein LOC115580777 [Sparus aurata]XP_030271279.1 uncharacterized protein LOC115580777 [Sparus aurata]XP_030271280.1 uncharacterized protein LOC115580777 [Sparus aurata]
MNLQFSSCFLFLGLFLSVSTLTPEECQPLVTPLSLEDPSMLHGMTHFITGYTDSAVYNELLNASDSYWMNITASPSSDKTLVCHQEHKLNGICYGMTVSFTIDGNVVTVNVGNMSAEYHVLPGCDGCVVLSGNSTVKDLNQYFGYMNYESSIKTDNMVNARVFYLMAKERTVKDSDLEKFKQQASCLGFSGEPDFDFDPKTDLCKEGEGSNMVLN